MELLSCQQLHEKFPTDIGQFRAWCSITEHWRSDGKLRENFHWKYIPNGFRPTRVYCLDRIVALICSEARSNHCRPFVSCLYQTHYESFCDILTAAAEAKAGK
jgi:hypothetical protein